MALYNHQAPQAALKSKKQMQVMKEWYQFLYILRDLTRSAARQKHENRTFDRGIFLVRTLRDQRCSAWFGPSFRQARSS